MRKERRIKLSKMKFNYQKNKASIYTLIIVVIIISLISLALAGISSNAQEAIAAVASHNSNNNVGSIDDILEKGNVAEIFDFGTGIFAAILFALSIIAYKNLKTKRILYVSFAFAIFAVRAIVSRLNLFIPEIESSSLETLLAIMGFAALALFFIAIVRREKVKTKTIHP
jgi:hypothetical protein